MKIYSRVARSRRLFTVSQRFASLGMHFVSPRNDYVHLPAFTGWGYSRDLPRFAGKTFRDRWDDLEKNTRKQVNAETGRQVNRYTGEQGVIKENTHEMILRDRATLVSQFTEELTKVSGSFIRTAPNELTDQILDFLKMRKINRIHLEPNVLDEAALVTAGIAISHAPDPALLVGVTKATCGLADTGSVLIVDGEGNPLQASLLPEIHIAVLCASDILPSLSEALKLPTVRTSPSAVVITGPSRTGDIEMSHTIGVHGPGEVNVFLIHGTASTLVHGTANTLVDD